jgi:hypothetical protein
MKLNYYWLIPLGILAIALIVFVIKRNLKDQKDLENELNERELKPNKHDEEHI